MGGSYPGENALQMHRLACMLARLWTSREATAIWVEFVAERQSILKKEMEEMEEMEDMEEGMEEGMEEEGEDGGHITARASRTAHSDRRNAAE